VKGKYTTKRDGGIEYTYTAECGMGGEDRKDWHWRAKVRRDGMLAGEPNGVILNARSFVEDPVLKYLVEDAIEKRIGVD
jgi:hypothetical protein